MDSEAVRNVEKDMDWDSMYDRICRSANSVSHWAEHIYPYRRQLDCYDMEVLEQTVGTLDLLATMMSFMADRMQDKEREE